MTKSFYHSSLYYLPTSSDIANEQVMSPTTEAKDDTDAEQARPATGHERAVVAPAAAVSPTAHARSAETDALAKVLEMLMGMDMRLQKMEASQARMDEHESMSGAAEREISSSMLVVDFAGRLHGGALELADLNEQPARRAPPRLDGPRTRARPAPQQRADPLPKPPAPSRHHRHRRCQRLKRYR